MRGRGRSGSPTLTIRWRLGNRNFLLPTHGGQFNVSVCRLKKLTIFLANYMEFSATTIIRRPPEEVYEYVGDVTNDVHWRNDIDDSGWRSDQPVSLGSVGYAKVGKIETVYRITVLEPVRRVDWEFIEGPFIGRGGYRLEAVGAGTRFTLVADIKPYGMMRLLGPLFYWIGRRSIQKDVETLRQIMEGSPI